jgi:hypothetical protein
MTHEQVAIQEMYKLNFTAEQIAATLQLPVEKIQEELDKQ